MKKKKTTDISEAFAGMMKPTGTFDESLDSSMTSEYDIPPSPPSERLAFSWPDWSWPDWSAIEWKLTQKWNLREWSNVEARVLSAKASPPSRWNLPPASDWRLPSCHTRGVSLRYTCWKWPDCLSPDWNILPEWMDDQRKSEVWITVRIVTAALVFGLIIGLPVRAGNNKDSTSLVSPAVLSTGEPPRFNEPLRKTYFPTMAPATQFPTLAPATVLSGNVQPTPSPTRKKNNQQEPKKSEEAAVQPITNRPEMSDETAKAGMPILINSGFNTSFIDSQGNHWESDTAYTDAGVTFGMQPCVHAFTAAIDDDLFCSGRMNVRRYDIALPNRAYAVTVHFINDVQDRTYDVYLETARVYRAIAYEDQEIVQESISSVHLETIVRDGSLTIEFGPIGGSPGPIVAAIEVHHTSANPVHALHNLTYLPGSLTVEQHGLILSEGLTAKILSNGTKRVHFKNGTRSAERFHPRPDAGATYPDEEPGNEGGWIYVSNSEAKVDRKKQIGGVGALTFDKDGDLIDYKMVLSGTKMNCGGGKTPWGAWISGEEYPNGRIWQVDPTGQREPQNITMGETHMGMFESFAMDDRDRSSPRFFMTKDDDAGALRRFTPNNPNWDDPWNILLGDGEMNYLVVEPSGEGSNAGTYRWVSNHTLASEAVPPHYPGSEGLDVDGNLLFMVSKTYRTMFILNLDDGTYVNQTTRHGLFWGQPDQVHAVAGPTDSMLYFTEDGGKYAGIHARDTLGQYFTILESHEYADETTGLAFSPDGLHMYIAYQDNHMLFDVTRQDGLPFQAKVLNVKFHADSAGRP